MIARNWSLWLDDQLDDPEVVGRKTPEGFDGAKSTDEAAEFVRLWGPPVMMDLDHDLGGGDSAMVFLRWLSEEFPYSCPAYLIHSENPIGRENIVAFMESWKRSIE